MRIRGIRFHHRPFLVMCFSLTAGCIAFVLEGDTQKPDATTSPPFNTETIRGRVIWMSQALQRRQGVKVVSEAEQRVLSLETKEGVLHPIVEDIRGRAFRSDARLRDVETELFVRRYRGSPFVQVIKVFQFDQGRKYELDYWCDICAITMFEIKLCECCQGEIELRRRLVAD